MAAVSIIIAEKFMRSKTQTSILLFLGFLLFAGTFGAGFASATVINRYLRPTAEEPETFGLFWETWGLVEKDFYGELPSDAELTYGAIQGSLTALDDPYSILVEPQPREMERDSLRGSFGGIGAFITQDQDQFLLEPIDENQPSAIAGILAGDVLLAIDGQPVTAEMTVEDVVVAIRGPIGEEVVLTVRHPDTEEPVEITIVRAVIELPSVYWRALDEDPTIGYLQIIRFTTRSEEEVQEALQEFTAAGVEKLILDLRHNGGGLLHSAVDVAGHFLDGDIVLYEKKSGEGEQSLEASQGGTALDLPLVVLVNGGTASASEIVAGALQDHQRATLIGQVTFGKGSVQNVYDLSDGSSLHITSARWFTPNHQQLDGHGLTPEFIVSLDDTDSDHQLARAIEFLQTGQ